MSAILNCSDGTKITISEETEKEMRSKFGKPHGFEPIKIGYITVGVDTYNYVYVKIKKNERAIRYPTDRGRDIGVWLSKIDREASSVIEAIKAALKYTKNI